MFDAMAVRTEDDASVELGFDVVFRTPVRRHLCDCRPLFIARVVAHQTPRIALVAARTASSGLALVGCTRVPVGGFVSRPAFSLASFHPPTARMIVADAGRNPGSSYSAFVGDSPNRSAASRNVSRHSASVVHIATDTGGNRFSARPGLELTFEIRKRVSYGLLYVVSGSTARCRTVVPTNSYTTPYQAPTVATSETYPMSPCSTAASRSSIPVRTRRPRSPSAPSSPS